MWAYATAGVEAAALFDAAAAEAVGRLRDFNPQDLANTVWAYTTAGVPAPALLTECARVTAWDADDLTQLHQWQLWVELEGAPSDARQRLPEPLRRRCREAMQAAPVHPSRLQRAVGRALDAVRPGFAEEVIDERTGYSLDLALVGRRPAEAAWVRGRRAARGNLASISPTVCCCHMLLSRAPEMRRLLEGVRLLYS